ncbi:MAG: TonB-dependent receptor [Paludibaculum sp.]
MTSKRLVDPTNGQVFANNVIPSSRLDSVASGLINLYPTPLTSNLASNYTFLSPRWQDVDKWDVRVDQNLGTKDTAFWRLSKQDVSVPDTPSLPAPAYGGGNLDYITEGYNTGAGWNHIFTPTLLLSVRAGWNFTLFKRDNPASTQGQLLNAKYRIQGGDNTIPGGFSQMSLTGYRALGIGGFNPVDRDSQNRQISGDLTWIRGRHNLKFGAGFLRSQNNILNQRNAVGNYSFNSQYTGDGAADFLLGYSNSWSWNTPVNVQLRTYNLSLYAQDDWKVTNRLTVNLGVRYEISPPWVEKYNKMGIFDIDTVPGQAKLVYAADGSRYGRALVTTDKNNFMPRVGFAYKVNDSTVIRAGYGLYYSYMEPFGDNEFLIGNPPFAYGVSLAGSTTNPAVVLAGGPPAGSTDFSKATGLQFSSFERDPKLSSAHQWNFNIQRQLPKDWFAEVGYSGSRGLHLVRQYEGNFSLPGAGALNSKRIYKSLEIPGTGITTSPLAEVYSHRYDGNSNYHALLTKIEKRFSGGFTLLGSYTFSKAIGDTCGGSAQGNATGVRVPGSALHEPGEGNRQPGRTAPLCGQHALRPAVRPRPRFRQVGASGGGCRGGRLEHRQHRHCLQRPAIQRCRVGQSGQHRQYQHRQPAECGGRSILHAAYGAAGLQHRGPGSQCGLHDRQRGQEYSAAAQSVRLGLLRPEVLAAPGSPAAAVPLRGVPVHQHTEIRHTGQHAGRGEFRNDHECGDTEESATRPEAGVVSPASLRLGRR